MIASCGFLENEMRQFCREQRSDSGRWPGNSGRRPENQSEKAGSKRKSEKKDVQSEILAQKEEQCPPHEGGSREVVTSGYDARGGRGEHVQWVWPLQKD